MTTVFAVQFLCNDRDRRYILGNIYDNLENAKKSLTSSTLGFIFQRDKNRTKYHSYEKYNIRECSIRSNKDDIIDDSRHDEIYVCHTFPNNKKYICIDIDNLENETKYFTYTIDENGKYILSYYEEKIDPIILVDDGTDFLVKI